MNPRNIPYPFQPCSKSQVTGGTFQSQRGVSLVVSLIFLVILTLLGLTAMRVATMEERMSGNARDRNIAFQAAEAALRDAEFDIRCQKYDGSSPYAGSRSPCISGLTGADAACTSGLCCNPSGLTCIEPSSPVHVSKSMSAAPSVAYGTYTGAPSIKVGSQNLFQQPSYLIEPFIVDSKNYYRITARGFGLNSNTQVTLQEVYKE